MIFFNLTNDIFQRGWAWTCLNHHHRPTVSRSSSSHSSSFLNSHSFPAPYSTSGSRYRLIFTKDDQFFLWVLYWLIFEPYPNAKKTLAQERDMTKPHKTTLQDSWHSLKWILWTDSFNSWGGQGLVGRWFVETEETFETPSRQKPAARCFNLAASISQWKTLQVGSRYHSALTIGTWNHLNLCACAFTALSTQQNKTMRIHEVIEPI